MPVGEDYRNKRQLKISAMASDAHPLKRILMSVDRESCPNSLNFHCHTTYSDGSLEPKELISQAAARGLKHLAVTDHHNSQAYQIMSNWLASRSNKNLPVPVLWTGVEISCLLNGCLVHVLALGFEVGHQAIHRYIQNDSVIGESLRAPAVLNSIHQAGGLAVLAHPARYRIGHTELINAAAEIGFDGVETWYDYDCLCKWHPTKYICEAIDKQLEQLGLLRTCGTDTHGYDLSGR